MRWRRPDSVRIRKKRRRRLPKRPPCDLSSNRNLRSGVQGLLISEHHTRTTSLFGSKGRIRNWAETNGWTLEDKESSKQQTSLWNCQLGKLGGLQKHFQYKIHGEASNLAQNSALAGSVLNLSFLPIRIPLRNFSSLYESRLVEGELGRCEEFYQVGRIRLGHWPESSPLISVRFGGKMEWYQEILPGTQNLFRIPAITIPSFLSLECVS